nr:hypothetical protein [Streptomyces sp. SID3343]
MSLAQVSLTAERTFVGLWTQADDHGRFTDVAAIIHGVLWPLRPEHRPEDVEHDLQELVGIGAICRYMGCDGRTYLHVVNWFKHQKIDRPSKSRLPVCPHHNPTTRCEPCGGVCASTHVSRALVEPSSSPRTAHGTRSPAPARVDEAIPPPAAQPGTTQGLDTGVAPDETDNFAGHTPVDKPSSSPRRGVAEDSSPGPRTLDLGPRTWGRTAPAPIDNDDAPRPHPTDADRSPTARTLLDEYVDRCENRPPDKVVGHAGREVASLLREGIDPDHVRAALELMRTKSLNPSTLASLVNEVLNPASRTTTAGYQPWRNPSDDSAYEEAL